MRETNQAFIANSVVGADFGDRRLVERLETILRAAVHAPSASFPKMCSDEAELEGTYRFLNNPKVSHEAVLKPHYAATAQRIRACQRVVVAHDSTQFGFGPVARGDLGLVGRGNTYGFDVHISLAVALEEIRTPLGVLAVTPYNRIFGKKRQLRGANKTNPDNATLRWSAHVARVREQVPDARHIVHVMDREADDYALLAELAGTGARFVVRQAVDRRLIADQNEPKVRSLVAPTPMVVERSVNISARRKPTRKRHASRHPLRNERSALLEVRALTVTIPKTSTAGANAPEMLTLNLVEAVEKNPPPGEEPVEWWLWTNEPIDTAESVLGVIDAYRARWTIEELFKALKTGCSFEERQLESKHALQNALAIFVPVAWRLLLMRTLARVAPTVPAAAALTSMQERALRGYMKRKRNIELPQPLTARDAMLAIAAMGGHIKNNGDPGWMVLGRGFDRLLEVEVGLTIALNL
jgi:hypothetical protein